MNQFSFVTLLHVMVTLAFTTCSGDGGQSAGDKTTYEADGVQFVMAYVPGGFTFPTGVHDDGSATVSSDYWVCDTEVTYELWYKVYQWAISNGYSFSNQGREGNDGIIGAEPTNAKYEPVTAINWRDSIVWCNALTEWYNIHNGTNFECVYEYSGNIIRDSRDSNAKVCDNAIVNSSAKGFRLLTSNEHELAARYRDGSFWTYGDHASGDDSGYCYNNGIPLGGMTESKVYGDYAVYQENALSTNAVKSKM